MNDDTRQVVAQIYDSAGLGKGTTVVDNDLINVAFLTGAGAAAGFLFGLLSSPTFDATRASVELMAFIQSCLAAGHTTS